MTTATIFETKTIAAAIKGDNLTKLAETLIADGLTVFTTQYSEDKPSTWLYFTDGKHFGYAQECESRCAVRFSTVHKPCKECGTGYGLQNPYEGVINPTAQDARGAFITAPKWAKWPDVKAIRKYNSMEDFAKCYSKGTVILLTI